MCCANGFDSDYILICHEGNYKPSVYRGTIYLKVRKGYYLN